MPPAKKTVTLDQDQPSLSLEEAPPATALTHASANQRVDQEDKSQKRDHRIPALLFLFVAVLLSVSVGSMLPENVALWPFSSILTSILLAGGSVFLWNQDRRIWSLAALILGILTFPAAPLSSLGPSLIHWLIEGTLGLSEAYIAPWLSIVLGFVAVFIGLELWQTKDMDDSDATEP